MFEKTRLWTLVKRLCTLIKNTRAKLVPVDDEVPEIFGCMRGSVTILGDLTEPIDEVWEAAG